MNKDTKKSLEQLIEYIKNTEDYKQVLVLKNDIDNDKELKKLIEEVRTYQKKYVKSSFNEEIKKELDKKLEELNSNKLFVTYSYHLDKVNDMIKLVKDELNEYFYQITNIL